MTLSYLKPLSEENFAWSAQVPYHHHRAPNGGKKLQSLPRVYERISNRCRRRRCRAAVEDKGSSHQLGLRMLVFLSILAAAAAAGSNTHRWLRENKIFFAVMIRNICSSTSFNNNNNRRRWWSNVPRGGGGRRRRVVFGLATATDTIENNDETTSESSCLGMRLMGSKRQVADHESSSSDIMMASSKKKGKKKTPAVKKKQQQQQKDPPPPKKQQEPSWFQSSLLGPTLFYGADGNKTSTADASSDPSKQEPPKQLTPAETKAADENKAAAKPDDARKKTDQPLTPFRVRKQPKKEPKPQRDVTILSLDDEQDGKKKSAAKRNEGTAASPPPTKQHEKPTTGAKDTKETTPPPPAASANSTTTAEKGSATSSNNENTTTASSSSSDQPSADRPAKANEDTATNSSTTSQQQQPQRQQQFLILGGTTPHGTTGGVVMAVPPGQRPLGSAGGPEQQPITPHATSSILIVEIVASVVRSLSRLWLLSWLARRIAAQDESIHPVQHFSFERLNDRYLRDASALQAVLQQPPVGVPKFRWRRHLRTWYGKLSPRELKRERRRGRVAQAAGEEADASATTALVEKEATNDDPYNSLLFHRTVLVLELDTTLSASKQDGSGTVHLNLPLLQDFCTLVLQQHAAHAFGTVRSTQKAKPLEVVLVLTSPGGSVAAYGLAAAQIQRLLTSAGTIEVPIQITVCVDQYAASGGYMIASQAHKLVAAPFSTLGSVGVILEGLNFYDLAKRVGIEPMVVKAGSEKNPLSTFGQVTSQNLAQERVRLEKVHDAFTDWIVQGRPGLADKLAKVAQGQVFLAGQALELGLIDEVKTSGQYLYECMQAGDLVLKVHPSHARFHAARRGSPLLDLLPHLFEKGRVLWSDGQLLPRLVQAGGVLGVLQRVWQAWRREG